MVFECVCMPCAAALLCQFRIVFCKCMVGFVCVCTFLNTPLHLDLCIKILKKAKWLSSYIFLIDGGRKEDVVMLAELV